MADNVELDPGTGGAIAATDDVAGVHFQRVKLVDGTAESTAAIAGDATNGLDVDVTRVIPGTSATHLGKAEDAAASSGDTGVAMLTVRQDTPTTDTSTDGDYQFAKSDSVGRVHVTVGNTVTVASHAVTNAGTFATQAAQSGAWNITDISGTVTLPTGAATAAKQPALGTAGTASADVITVQGVASMTPLLAAQSGTWNVTINAAIAAGNNNIGDVDIASIAAGDNNIGNVDVVSLPALAAGTNNIGDVDVLTLPGAAHDAAVSGNPVRIAGRARTSNYTAVVNDDTADFVCTLNGHQVVQPFAIPENTWSYAAASGGIVNTTGVTAKAAAGAGVRNYITGVDVVNGHATVSTEVVIRDGAAGTVIWRGFAQAAGGGVSRVFDPPLRGTANTLVEIANITTGSATYFNLNGYVGP